MGAYRRGGIHKQPELGGSVFSLSEAVGWLEALAAALDSYNWVLGEEFVAAKEVFTGILYGVSVIYYYVVPCYNIVAWLHGHMNKRVLAIHTIALSTAGERGEGGGK